jgi:NAD(P)-dependent dehydrogenase (short-subunit alcohol dehydrogenase family)
MFVDARTASDYRPDLTGRVALVTGGSRGLGREMVRAFAECGADVVIASRKLDECRRVADEVSSATGREAEAISCHVGHWAEVDELVERAWARFGHVDVVVNNAGMSPTYPDPASVTEELFDKVIGVNLKGPFRLIALAGTRMAAAGRGSIVNISATGATRPTAHVLPYAAAKAGLNALTMGFAQAFGPAVRVNGIIAGPFLTDVSRAWDPEVTRERTARYAMGRPGHPAEIVGAVLYFASDASSFTTGALLRVDGGQP